MMTCLAIDLKKLTRRKDIWIGICILIAIPLLFSYFTAADSDFIEVGDSVFSGAAYIMGSLGLIRMLFIFYIFIILHASLLIAQEIDKGILPMYKVKAKGRMPILFSHFTALILLTLLLYLVSTGAGAAGWQLFLRGTEHGTTSFADASDDVNAVCFFFIVSAFMECLILAAFTGLASLFLKFNQTLMAAFAFLLFQKGLERIKPIQAWIPTYLGEAKNLFDLTGDEIVHRATLNLIILTVYFLILLGLALLRFRKMDLIR